MSEHRRKLRKAQKTITAALSRLETQLSIMDRWSAEIKWCKETVERQLKDVDVALRDCQLHDLVHVPNAVIVLSHHSDFDQKVGTLTDARRKNCSVRFSDSEPSWEFALADVVPAPEFKAA